LQIFSFVLTTLTVFIFFVNFCHDIYEDGNEVQSHTLLPFEHGDYSLAITATCVSYMYAMFLPSWINEKQPHVPIRGTIWIIGIIAMIVYIVVGLLCAIAHPFIRDDNVMQFIYEDKHTTHALRVVILIFIFTAVLPGVPINSLAVKYNLYVSGVCGPKMAFFWGSVSPYLVAWIFSSRALGVGVLMWTAVFFGGVVNFVVPPILYYLGCQRVEGTQSRLRESQAQGADDLIEAAQPKDLVTAYNSEAFQKDIPWSEASVIQREYYVFQGKLRQHYGKISMGIVVLYTSLWIFLVLYALLVKVKGPCPGCHA
jgi:hypothetical protein